MRTCDRKHHRYRLGFDNLEAIIELTQVVKRIVILIDWTTDSIASVRIAPNRLNKEILK